MCLLHNKFCRGTSFGIFYTVMALNVVVSNGLMGHVWHTQGAQAAFLLSAGLTAVALLIMPRLVPAEKTDEAVPAAAAAAS